MKNAVPRLRCVNALRGAISTAFDKLRRRLPASRAHRAPARRASRTPTAFCSRPATSAISGSTGGRSTSPRWRKWDFGLLTVAEPAIGHGERIVNPRGRPAQSSARPRDTSPLSGSPVVASAVRPRPYSTAPDRGSSACARVEQSLCRVRAIRGQLQFRSPDEARHVIRLHGERASKRGRGLLDAVSASQGVTQVVRPPHVRRSKCPGVDEARLRGIEVLGGKKQSSPSLRTRRRAQLATRPCPRSFSSATVYRSRSCAWTSDEACEMSGRDTACSAGDSVAGV